jgi:cation diffusion facilitator CzcD-associated flavoprotein CzcO
MLAAVSGAQDGAGEYHRYVVIGAGPGGLQIAHYLEAAGRDYVVLEKVGACSEFDPRIPHLPL